MSEMPWDLFTTAFDQLPEHIRAPRGPRPISEAQHRDVALDRLERLRAEYLQRIRAEMRILCARRAAELRVRGCWMRGDQREGEAFVTADDARVTFEAFGPPADLSRNFLGQVFRDGRWRALPGRRVLSQTPGSHANELKCWQLIPNTGADA